MSWRAVSLCAAGAIAALLALGAFLPNWLLFLVTMAASHGVVSLGILLIMRGGLVSFGQGLFFAIGGYGVALAVAQLGVTDAILLILLGGIAAGPLGASVRAVMAINFALAAVLGGVGGALTVLALGHIEPTFAYWTQSGEFVFIAILAGPRSVGAIFVASLMLELVRSFSSLYFPNTWQLALGVFLLMIILFLPGGIGSLPT